LARYTDPVCRLCRREGVKLYLKGHRCYTPKCPIERRAYPPGEHGAARRKLSEYALHLREKQKARRIYGVLERQFRNTFAKASRRKGVTGTALLQMLERRLDNVVFRLGFASSRPEGRQMVRHGHFEVNGRRVNIPSYLVRAGDVIAVRERSRGLQLFKDRLEEARVRSVPDWLQLEPEAMRGVVLRIPERSEVDTVLQEHLIVEHYSR
jgi:small subunit ribosomal protein S4